jgi:hypothetical protein
MLDFGNTLDNVIVMVLASGTSDMRAQAGPGTISQEVYDMTLVRRASRPGGFLTTATGRVGA